MVDVLMNSLNCTLFITFVEKYCHVKISQFLLEFGKTFLNGKSDTLFIKGAMVYNVNTDSVIYVSAS